MDVFPKYIMKVNRGFENNEIKFFYTQKSLYENIMYEWGKGEIVVQNYITPKSKHASLLRYEITSEQKIKAYILLNQFDISKFPYLKYSDIVAFNKPEHRSPNSSSEEGI
jgi:hypothetical protein